MGWNKNLVQAILVKRPHSISGTGQRTPRKQLTKENTFRTTKQTSPPSTQTEFLCSRAVYWSSRVFFRKQGHGHLQDSRSLSGKKVHGHFLNSRALFFIIHGRFFFFTGTFTKMFTGTFLRFTGEKTLPGSKSEALQLGVHLIFLYFIRIWILSAETFFFDGGWWMVGGWWWVGTTFWFFKSLDINVVYTLGVYVYI